MQPKLINQRDLEEALGRMTEQLVGRLADKRQFSAGITFGELYEKYMQDYARPHLKSWKDMERSYKNYLCHWADKDCHAITRSEVQGWHSSLGAKKGHTMANRALEFLTMLYNKGIAWDLLAMYNPGSKIRKFKLQSRSRFLQPEELARFFAALNTLRFDTTRDFFTVCLFTAARKSNVLSMKWDDISFARKSWQIPETKNGDPQIVPLIPEAMAILRHRKLTTKSAWVFPGQNGNHLYRVDKAWGNLIKKAGIEGLRLHDLRRSMASWEAITNCNISTIAATLGHKDLSSTQIYARLNIGPVRNAMSTAARAMLEAAGIAYVEGDDEEDSDTLEAIGPAFQQSADDPWIDPVKAADLSGTSVGALQQLRFQNSGPPYLKQGYMILYRTSMIQAWFHGRGE
jgi:integrase